MALNLRAGRLIAPYAPLRNVLEVLQRLRERGLQVPVTLDTLTVLGVPEGNAPRTLQPLKLLGLVAEDGQLEPAAERLHRATTEEYPRLLEEILHKAYAPIFEVTEPATATEVQIADAFRQYDPAAQRPRMVSLFLGLCVEAGIAQKPSRTSAAPRREAPRRAPASERVASTPRFYRAPPGAVPSISPRLTVESAGLYGVIEDDLALLDETQFKVLWDALGTVAMAKAKARAAERAKAARPTSEFFDQFLKATPKEEPPAEEG